MTLRTPTLMRVAFITLGVFELSVVPFPAAADQYTANPGPCGVTTSQSSCARIVVKPSFVVKNLHPAVGRVSVWCATKIGEPDVWATAESVPQAVYARDASFTPVGSPPPTIGLLKSGLTAGQVFAVTCELMLTRYLNDGSAVRRVAVASAATPQLITDTNWHIVAAGSIVKWTQNITFPSTAQVLEATPRRGAATP